MTFWIFITAVFLATLAGGALPMVLKKTGRVARLAVPFAAGFLTGAALFHLMPESYELAGTRTGFAILFGFAFFYLPQKFMLAHPCEEEDCHFHQLGKLAFFGIGVHALMDGVAVGAAEQLPDFHLIVAAVVTHKVPAAVALSLILLAAGIDKRTTAGYLFLFSLAAPLGAVGTRFFLLDYPPLWLGLALGFSAGNFLAIAGSDLLRRLHEHPDPQRGVGLVMIALGLGLTLIGGHIH